MLAIIVNTSVDERDFDITDGDVSLRDAILEAPVGETINFAPSLNGATIALLPSLGEIAFAKSLTIDGRDSNGVPRGITIKGGAGANPVIGNGDGFRIFNITGSGSVEINGLTLTGGDTGVGFGGAGGAIRSTANLVVKNSIVTGNASLDNGGGIYASGNLTIEDSTISANQAGDGAGIFTSGDTVSINRSTIKDNIAPNAGGGIKTSGGTVSIVDSTISGNQATAAFAGLGAGIFSDGGGTVNVTTSTISGNTAGYKGGGIYLSTGNLTLTNSTVSGNSATNQYGQGSGGGIFADTGNTIEIKHSTITNNSVAAGGIGGGIRSLGDVNLNHTIVAGNFRGTVSTRDDVSGGTFNATYSLVGDSSGATVINVVGSSGLIGTSGSPVNAVLGALENNGGRTKTHMLLAGSPAIDRGNPSLVGAPSFDQRGTGFPRVVNVPGVNGEGTIIDIGAYEIGLPKVIEVILSDSVGTFSHAPYNFATVVGSGEQLRTVPVGGANRIQIRFSEVVTVGAGTAPVTVQSARTLAFYTDGTVTHNGNVITWTRDGGGFSTDQIILRVDDSVSGLAGFLDGEWENPTSLNDSSSDTFPSGNGTALGDFIFHFTILNADFNRTNIVDAADYVIWRKFDGTSGASHGQGDADGNGDVDVSDYYYWYYQFGLNFTQWPT